MPIVRSVALLALVFVACGGAPDEPAGAADAVAVAQAAQPGDAAAPEAAKPIPAELPDPVARVNGEAIPRAELERALRTLESRAGEPMPLERRAEIVRGLLDQLVAVRLLAQESRARQVAVSDADVEVRFGQIRRQFPTEEAFSQALAERQITSDRLRQDLRTDLAVAELLEREVEPAVNVGDADPKVFYDQNPERFQQDEMVRASHILFRVTAEDGEAARKQARAQADEALEAVRGGADFATVARERSQDPGSAPNGGDLDFFARGQMVPAFETAAFGLQPNQISGIVESPFGLHIIKVTGRRPPQMASFQEVEGQIKEFLTQQQREEKTNAFIDALKKRGRVEILF